MSFQQKTDVYL